MIALSLSQPLAALVAHGSISHIWLPHRYNLGSSDLVIHAGSRTQEFTDATLAAKARDYLAGVKNAFLGTCRLSQEGRVQDGIVPGDVDADLIGALVFPENSYCVKIQTPKAFFAPIPFVWHPEDPVHGPAFFEVPEIFARTMGEPAPRKSAERKGVKL